MDEKQFKQVLIEDFNSRELRKYAKEGKLFIDVSPTKPTDTSDTLHQVLVYVDAIKPYVTPVCERYITQLWGEIVTNPILNTLMLLTKGKNTGRLNRYHIISWVDNLRALNVYDPKVSLAYYHHQLENTNHKDSIYTGRNNYPVQRQQIQIIRTLLKEITKNNEV